MKRHVVTLLSFFLVGCLSQTHIENLSEYSDLNPLPDAIPVLDEGKVYILTDPTTEYGHGILGDAIEAKSLTIIEGDDIRKIDFSPQVFEGLFPLLADLDGDNKKEIIATLSGNGAGAQLVVYDQEGNKIASSDALSSGWRHALAVFPFGPNGELELADVSRPHMWQEVEFFQLKKDELVKVAGIRRYSTHTIGSRNLNLFGVFKDNRYLLIVPTPDFKSIAAIGRTSTGAEEVWRIEIGEKIYSISVEEDKVKINGKYVHVPTEDSKLNSICHLIQSIIYQQLNSSSFSLILSLYTWYGYSKV